MPMNAKDAAAYVDRHAQNYNVTLTAQERNRLIWAAAGGSGVTELAGYQGSDAGVAAFLQDRGRSNGSVPGPVGTRPIEGPKNPPASPAPPAENTNNNAATAAAFRNQLRQDGLEELEQYVDVWVTQNLSWEEIVARLDDLSTPEGQVVDRLHPERRLLREAGRAPMSIAQLRFYKDQASSMFRAAGMPSTFYDQPSDFTHFIVGGVDLEELQERVGVAVDWGTNASAETKQQLKDLYGVDEGGISAYVLDRGRALPALERQRHAASLAAAGVRGRFGALTRSEAERLAELGVTDAQAEERFGALSAVPELLQPIVGERGGDTLTRDEQLAVVAGDRAGVDEIGRQSARRAAPFRGRGGVASNREGYAGLGATSR